MGMKHIVMLAVAVLVIAILLEKGPFKKSNCFQDKVDDVYDYIVVGGGTAGSVVASRLAEDTLSKVLLIEAGGHYDNSPLFGIPIKWAFLQTSLDYLWPYYTEPQTDAFQGMIEKRANLGRGRVLGGTSAINAMQYTRGSRYDFDNWAKNGCTGWSYEEVLPYFLKSEDIHIPELKASKYHNVGGPLAVSGGDVTPLADLYMNAGRELGYNITDYNGEDPIGFNKIQVTVRKGVRSSTGKEFLNNKCNQENIHVSLNSVAIKLEIQNKEAKGVFFVKNGKKYFVRAKKEIILSAGSINSPQLLMLSGIGPRKDLEKLKIPIVVDLPVGQNLQDHQMAFLYSRINKPLSITSDVLESCWTYLQYMLFGQGPISSSGSDGSAFLYADTTKTNNTYPDLQFIIMSNLFSVNAFGFVEEVLPEVLAKPTDHGFTISVTVSHPKSIGYVKLRSNDPFDQPFLNPRYLTDARDVSTYIKGIRAWEQYIQTPTMKELGVDINNMNLSICSKHDFRSDAYWECFLRSLAIGCYHHTGTCKMGANEDPTAVVDPELRVKGINGLRVADASIIPDITSGNTMAPTIMVGEKASDMIRGINTVGHLKRKINRHK